MASEFEQYVSQWEDLTEKIEKNKAEMKATVAKELEMRKAIATAVAAALGDSLKEGMNNYVLPDGRTLKYNRGIKREIEAAAINVVRNQYNLLNDRPVVFDELIRTKYELEKKCFNKLDGEALKVVSRMIVTSESTPTLTVE